MSQKTVTLLALTTGHIMETLAFIDIRNIERFEDHVVIKIPAKIKTSRNNKKQPTPVLPIFKENPSICVVTALDEYLLKTESLRASGYNLFVSWKKPHNAISSQTLSQWIKAILEKSGIDTSQFTGCSTRHAAISAAKASGISIDLIRKTAGWTSTSQTFARFYDRKVIEDPKLFAQAVLAKIKK